MDTSFFDLCRNGFPDGNISDKDYLEIFTKKYIPPKSIGKKRKLKDSKSKELKSESECPLKDGCPICYCELTPENARVVRCPSGKHILDDVCALSCFRRTTMCPCCREIFSDEYHIYIRKCISAKINEFKEIGGDINVKDESGFNPLMIAIINQQKNVVIELLKAGADVNCTMPNGNHIIHMAYIADTEDDEEDEDDYFYGLSYLSMIFPYGPDLNAKDYNGNSILHSIILDDEIQLLGYLRYFAENEGNTIRNPIDANLPNKEGLTPLGVCGKFLLYDLFKELIDWSVVAPYCCDVTTGDSIIQVIIRNYSREDNYFVQFIQCLEDFGNCDGYVPHTNNRGQTDFHLCVEYNQITILKYLVYYVDDILTNTPPDIDDPDYDPFMDPSTIQYRFKNFRTMKDKSGLSPIFLACCIDRLEAFELLYVPGDENLLGPDDKTLLHYAQTIGRTKMIEIIEKKGLKSWLQ